MRRDLERAGWGRHFLLSERNVFTHTHTLTHTHTHPPKNTGRYIEPELLISPWSKLNYALPLGAFVFSLTSAFFGAPLQYYVIKELNLNAAASNVALQMVVCIHVFI
jgi:hypothetical protein